MDAVSAYTTISGVYDAMGKAGNVISETQKDNGFQKVFQSALDMVNETSDLQNKAESAEIQFALGLSNNTHDLQIAQEKANVALGVPNLPIMVGIVRKYLKIRICYSSPPCRARWK